MIPDVNHSESSQLQSEPIVQPSVEPGDASAEDMPSTLISVPAIDDGDDMPTVVLPMQLVGLDAAALTDVGQQREHNEDYFGLTLVMDQQKSPAAAQIQAKGLYVLCDGMGGHAGGEVASRMAVETLQEGLRQSWYAQPTMALPTAAEIVAAIHAANTKIYHQNLESARMGNGRMGTTLVMLLLCGNQVAVAHVGDSRLYSFNRKQGLMQLTTDHEVGQREIQKGTTPEEAYARPDAYQLTQALGPRDNQLVDPGLKFIELVEDTLFILASDGLTDNELLSGCLSDILEPMLYGHLGLEPGVQKLIDVANQYNGHDNITAIAVRMQVRPNLASAI